MKKTVNYAESSDEDDQDVFEALKVRRSRNRSRVVAEDDDDDFEAAKVAEVEEYDGMLQRTLARLTQADQKQKTWT